MKLLSIVLNEKSGVPFYKQVIQQVELLIISGKLKSGDKLPTIRQLAIDLKINPNTIQKAYNELELKGIVRTQVGNGTFVSDKKIDEDDLVKQDKINVLCADFLKKAMELGFNQNQVLTILNDFIKGGS